MDHPGHLIRFRFQVPAAAVTSLTSLGSRPSFAIPGARPRMGIPPPYLLTQASDPHGCAISCWHPCACGDAGLHPATASASPRRHPVQKLRLSEFEMGWVMSVFFHHLRPLSRFHGWLATSGDAVGPDPVRRPVVSCRRTGWPGGGNDHPVLAPGPWGSPRPASPLYHQFPGEWFPATRRGLVNGLLGSCMQIGARSLQSWPVAPGPLGWQWLFVLCAVPGLPGPPGSSSGSGSARGTPGRPRRERALIGGPRAGPREKGAAESPEPTPWKASFTSRAMRFNAASSSSARRGTCLRELFGHFLEKKPDTSATYRPHPDQPAIGLRVAVDRGLVSDWCARPQGTVRLAGKACRVSSWPVPCSSCGVYIRNAG